MDLELRRKSVRYRMDILCSIHQAGAGHTGGSLSCVDLLNVLYNRVLKVDPSHPGDPERDRFVQSKGHSVEALYVVLADAGFFPKEQLQTLCRYQSPFVGHPTRKIPGIEQNTGALGHGLPVACGMALGARMSYRDSRAFVLLGDGELAEGSNWEAAMLASHYQLGRLTAVVDHNRLQITGETSDVMGLEPLAEKWRSFGWEVIEADGHDLEGLVAVLDAVSQSYAPPRLILAHTIKGKGISFMENQKSWHHGVPSDEEMDRAMAELEQAYANLNDGDTTSGG